MIHTFALCLSYYNRTILTDLSIQSTFMYAWILTIHELRQSSVDTSYHHSGRIPEMLSMPWDEQIYPQMRRPRLYLSGLSPVRSQSFGHHGRSIVKSLSNNMQMSSLGPICQKDTRLIWPMGLNQVSWSQKQPMMGAIWCHLPVSEGLWPIMGVITTTVTVLLSMCIHDKDSEACLGCAWVEVLQSGFPQVLSDWVISFHSRQTWSVDARWVTWRGMTPMKFAITRIWVRFGR